MSLNDLLSKQKSYNNLIRKEAKVDDPEYWTQIYLLGLVSEVDEVLREISWKRHRKHHLHSVSSRNIGYELADLFKYVLSLFEVWGFSATQIEEFVDMKSKALMLQHEQEFMEIPKDVPIVITDIDGTLGDWRKTFEEWLAGKGIKPEYKDSVRTLRIDEDLSMRYPDYYDLKEEFEASGEYRNIEVYDDARIVLQNLRREYNAFVIAITARPADKYKRIWLDTWEWLQKNSIPVDKLLIGSDPRILLAHSLSQGQKVIMLEDDPGLIMRGANSGIKIFARSHPYNSGIQHPNVRRTSTYIDIPTRDFFG